MHRRMVAVVAANFSFSHPLCLPRGIVVFSLVFPVALLHCLPCPRLPGVRSPAGGRPSDRAVPALLSKPAMTSCRIFVLACET